MQKYFFLVCPTDCLEPAINKTFQYENYFYATLGNSFIYDRKTINSIGQIIKKHSIDKMYFVLSLNNKIVLDALGKKSFSSIAVLNNLHKEINREKVRTKIAFENSNEQFEVISYYLNKKIKELTLQLTNLTTVPITIGGKIYHRDQDIFTNIYSDLVCLEKYHLN